MSSSIGMADFYRLSEEKNLPIIDVREAYEYQTGHVPHAKNLPLSSLGASTSELDKETEYYLICQSGARSDNACGFLSNQGYKVINVLGGTAAWPGELQR
ncbi:rhodanese-like domain-containing protein [Enterococcus raffinosus]|uniref:rhodanese-like domain-containing protein n=1 Tax=Enterococcus raffinosus TaxID=71452 RepID=UPI001C110F8B|nr:rhodanese-like domain-containing protein [Enterococcus raffinosus]MBU5361027.1 rhodanese-like domain-containing protein [Enterococcus raffinosus]